LSWTTKQNNNIKNNIFTSASLWQFSEAMQFAFQIPFVPRLKLPDLMLPVQSTKLNVGSAVSNVVTVASISIGYTTHCLVCARICSFIPWYLCFHTRLYAPFFSTKNLSKFKNKKFNKRLKKVCIKLCWTTKIK